MESLIINSLEIYFETEIKNYVELKNDEVVVDLADGTKAKIKIERVG